MFKDLDLGLDLGRGLGLRMYGLDLEGCCVGLGLRVQKTRLKKNPTLWDLL